ncbi:MAG TPA: IPT/TIG domain-containing protein [Solirubrobacteraceae bacterium]|nr:IPT/TIG domain-containing protein [Solirubrobacteraceae bacterium]
MPAPGIETATEAVDGEAAARFAPPHLALRALMALALLSLAAGLVLHETLGVGGQPGSPAPARTAARAGLASLPLSARASVSAVLGGQEPAYRVQPGAFGYRALNPAQRLRLAFGRSGATVRSGALAIGLQLRAVGYGRALSPVAGASPRARANRVVYAHRGVREWYLNGPLGLEQGFTLAAAPAQLPNAAASTLTLSLAISGGARAELEPGGAGITLSRPGAPSLSYDQLSATDARGRSLRSWIGMRAGLLLLHVDAAGALYPLRIDPLIQQAKLVSGETTGTGRFALSVALSADGATALIGEPRESNEIGAAWVFTRSGSTWTEQAKLKGSEKLGGFFGRNVALSGDGNTALVGEPGRGGNIGAAWFFSRSGSSWSSAMVQGGGEEGAGQFGARAALSFEGHTAIIGGFTDNGGGLSRSGAVWVFTGSGTSWTQRTELHGKEENGAFGRSVALSADGGTALIGAPHDGGRVGAAFVFTGSGASWSEQAQLHGAGEVGKGEFGQGAALSEHGDTALIGGCEDDERIGAAWVFTRSGTLWTQQGSKLTPSDETGAGKFGSALALTANGNTALIGGETDGSGLGAAWVFDRFGTVWDQQEPKLLGAGEGGSGRFGGGVAISSTGGDALIGGYEDTGALGAAWAFVASAPTVTSIEPRQGPEAGGTNVTITGSGFEEPATVSFGSNPATDVEVLSPTEIRARAPAGSGKVVVTVTTGEGTGATSATDLFTYTEPIVVLDESHKGPLGGTSVGVKPGAGVLPFVTTLIPPPVLAVSGNIAPVSGTVLVKVPGSTTFVPLSSLRDVPFGTIVNAIDGSVVVTTAQPHGGTQTGEFLLGEFILDQGHNGVVVAKLTGGNYGVCPKPRKRRHHAHASSSRGKHVVRKLWSNAHGSFATRGSYAVGAVQGTEWLTEDLCEGTLIRVRRDKVKVTDLVHHRIHIVLAGHQYLVRI